MSLTSEANDPRLPGDQREARVVKIAAARMKGRGTASQHSGEGVHAKGACRVNNGG